MLPVPVSRRRIADPPVSVFGPASGVAAPGAAAGGGLSAAAGGGGGLAGIAAGAVLGTGAAGRGGATDCSRLRSWARSAVADSGRWPGCLAIRLSISGCRPACSGGSFGTGSVACMMMTDSGSGASNGRLPASISNRITPRL